MDVAVCTPVPSVAATVGELSYAIDATLYLIYPTYSCN